MAVQIYDRPSTSALLGQSLGQGLSGLVDNYLTNKGLMRLGLSSQQAAGMSNMPPQLQQVALKSMMDEVNRRNMMMSLLGGQPGSPMAQQSLGAGPAVQAGPAAQLGAPVQQQIPQQVAAQAVQQQVAQQPQVQGEISSRDIFDKSGDVVLPESFKAYLDKNARKSGIPESLDINKNVAFNMASGLPLQQSVMLAGVKAKAAQAERKEKSSIFNRKWERFDDKLEKNNESMQVLGDRLRNYENMEALLDGGDINPGAFEALKEKYGIQDWASNASTQLLRKSLAREPLDFLKNLVKEGGATAVRTKAVFDKIAEATGKMTNTKNGLRAIINMNKSIADLQSKKYKLMEAIGDYYRDKGYSPPGNVGRLANKLLEPEMEKAANSASETLMSTKIGKIKGLAERYREQLKSGANITLNDDRGRRFRVTRVTPDGYAYVSYVGKAKKE